MFNENIKVLVENASEMVKNDPEKFAMIRRAGFGASDSSVLLGVNPFPNGTLKKLIEQKRASTPTEDEKKIGKMVNVRKGSDLEPLIIQKFQEKFDIKEEHLIKPADMYQIIGTPLNVNFDGVWTTVGGMNIPVECKYVSVGGQRYYNLSKGIHDLMSIPDIAHLGSEVNSIYLARRAEECGIPIYYYTQIQQQLMALEAPFGYLAALFDKDWELRVFPVVSDKNVWKKLKQVAEEVWETI